MYSSVWWRVIELGRISTDLFLFRCMLLEEWRLQRAYVGGFGSYFFPLIILAFSFFLVVIFPLEDAKSSSVIEIIHLLMFIYGIAVGWIALMGEQVMTRRMGHVNLLLKLSQVQNISFRRTTAIFYLKELFFYHTYSMVPFCLGLAAGGMVSGLPLAGSLMVSLTVVLVFTQGMSLSFAVSGVLTRSRRFGILLILLSVILISAPVSIGLLDPVILVHPLYFHRTEDPIYLLAAVLEIIFLSIIAIIMMKEKVTSPVKNFRSSLLPLPDRFPGSGRKRALLAKEWLELRRSRTMWPVLIGFLVPLLAVYGLVYLLDRGLDIDIHFNVVFFGALIGAFGVMTYSWLNNVETNESLDSLPVTVGEVIRTKLWLYFLFTSIISSLYITAIGLIQGEIPMIPLGILVGLSTNFYIAHVTARLTGLRTNTMLLDAVTLSGFISLVMPPLVALAILSFYLEDGAIWSVASTIVVSMLLVLAGLFFRRSTEPRWYRERFGI
ncbi:MAG: hypothetical protein JW939_00860 [Candidatus Thermoplasmatota archaeon]|nr:hypothetical protein [Candidatus Thermoplasmatota archaeon]